MTHRPSSYDDLYARALGMQPGECIHVDVGITDLAKMRRVRGNLIRLLENVGRSSDFRTVTIPGRPGFLMLRAPAGDPETYPVDMRMRSATTHEDDR